MKPPHICGRVGANGALLAADPLLLNLQERAGAALGEALAIPQIARAVAASIHSQKMLQTLVMFGDEGRTVTAFLDVTPDGDGADIVLRDWRSGPRKITPHEAANEARPSDMGWSWECNADLRLIALRAGPQSAAPPKDWKGHLFVEIFDLHANAEGQFPMLQARQFCRDFGGQHISVSNNVGHDMLFSGVACFDGRGAFTGYHGVAEPLRTDQIGECPQFDELAVEAIELGFNRRVESALRHPINRIITSAESIAAEAEGPIKEGYARYAGDIAEAGRHLLALVDDLADLQSIERPDFKVDGDAIDLGEVARRAAGLLAINASAKDILIHTPIVGEYMPATGDVRRALQIVLNLLGNAIRYSPEKTEIWIRLARIDGFACISVSDQGPGIPSSQHQSLFEKFERLGRRGGGGSGLGLYLAKRLAEKMDGDLLVESEAGAGATFTLRLPFRG